VSGGEVIWKPTLIGGRESDPVFGTLPSRGGALFASISEVVGGGRWNCNVFPEGKDSARTFHFYASSEAKGKALIERWASHHWQTVTMRVVKIDGRGGI
jgi:hypothetical protein